MPPTGRQAAVSTRRLEGAPPEPGEDVSPVRRVEVAPGVAEHAAARGPAATAQDFMIAEPGLGVVFVWVENEAGM